MSNRRHLGNSTVVLLSSILALALGTGCSPSETEGETASTSSVVEVSTTSISEVEAHEQIAQQGLDTSPSIEAHRNELVAQLGELPVAALTDEEIDGLLWMREEEKLAHDVYVALYELWDVQVFDNISSAETIHADSVGVLLDRHGIEDPSKNNPEGVFDNPIIQGLYDELTERGSESLVKAFGVGAYIEELDISDLRARASDAADLAMVYGDLERGSRNHLRAFTRNLDRWGETYVPTVLTQSDFDEIVDSPNEKGNGLLEASGTQSGSGRGYRGGRAG